MNDAFFKPSLNVGSFVGENSSVDTERFLLFMQAYYEWMQSSTITLTSKTGTFVVGETVVGAASGATAIIKEVKTDSIIVKLTTRTVFDYSEVVEGQTSNATATVNITKDNVGRATGNVLNYKTLETSVDKYVDYLREELYPSIPATYYGDKRLVAQYFKDFYESKSNEQSYRFLFKLLYDEDIDFYYPGTDVLRVSDGNFEKTQIIRTVAVATGTNSLGVPFDRDIFLFLNKTIRGQSSGFLANVVDIKKFFIGSREVAEMTLKLVSGTFTAGESIVDIDDANLVTTIYGIISGVTIVDGGSGYEEGDNIIISGDGSEAQARVSSIKESPISALTVNTIGHGYQLNTAATINNTGTGGSGFIVRVTELANTYSVTSGANTYTVGEVSQVSVINRGEGYFKKPSITLQDTTIASLGLLSDKLITISNGGSNYGVGNTLVFTGGAGTSAAGQIASVVESTTFDLLFEDGFQMKADGSYYDIIKNEDWAVVGPIKRIELTNFGTGYTSASLPVITINTTTGSSANLIATNVQGKSATVTVDTSNNITGIGSIRAVEIVNFGINYSAANASTFALGDGNAILSPVISGLGIKQGVWLDDDGKIDYKIIQDSFFYQDYSYVIKSGLTFQTYSNTLKSIIHPAGLIYFGEIQILNNLDVAAELINNEEISRMLVRIFAQIYVGGDYEYSSINWTIKVEAPVLRLDTDLLNVQEYVIHLVPEGDEETGITDVGVIINEGGARHSFIIQTPFEVNVTSTSETLPTTKFVVSKFDIVPGYGNNTYGNLPMIPFGVYGDYWAGTPISVLQDIRFSDLYSENPAYQSILNLYIDNTIDVGVYNTFTRLNFETFAVSGTIPLVQSIVTTESLIIKPEIPIQLTLNDVGVSMSTEMQRELPVLIVETSTLNVAKEYKLTGHGNKRTKYESILLEDYQSVLISAVENIAFDDTIISASAFVDIHVEADVISSTVAYQKFSFTQDIGISISTEMQRELPVLVTLADLDTYGEYVVVMTPTPAVLDISVAASSIAPQKSKSAGNIIALYDIKLQDVAISDTVGNVFGDNLPQNEYEGTIGSFANSTFGASYLNYPKTYHEYIKVLPATTTELNNLSVNREIVVRSEGNGFRYTIYDDALISDYESTPISTLSDITFDTNFDTTVYDVTIKATTSPYTSGQSARRNPTDIFRNETRIDIQSASDGYALPYDDLPISALFEYAISDTLYDRPLSTETFGTTYPSLYTASDYTTYAKIAGTVSSANAGFSTLPLSAFSTTAIDAVDESLLSDLVPIVIGATTGLTQPSQNVSGTNSNTGFFFYGWGDEPSSDDLTFSSIQVGWTVVGQPTWVVTAVGDGSTNYNVTISGGEFASGGTYRFTGMIIGGTNFVSDFSLGSVFVANNEYFKVESIANTTYMITDRLPANAFSGVVAYRIPTPTYTFSSIPTSINEGANGTFNVTTTDIANGTALYWTINNVTTGSGDFV
jgi:hypothetical protein